MKQSNFEWDAAKDTLNQEKHSISFAVAQYAFADPQRVTPKTKNTAAQKIGITALAK